ncbi:MAG: hypothetical protein KDE35_16680 [Geminicoccaceae bacterium]|nr:hypothetical protein [Geminicoccaceae bacterium]
MTDLLETSTVVENENDRSSAWSRRDGPVRELHLVRVEDLEFYFFEFDDALRKLYAEPEATLERITVH